MHGGGGHDHESHVDYVVLELFKRKTSQNISTCDVKNWINVFVLCVLFNNAVSMEGLE